MKKALVLALVALPLSVLAEPPAHIDVSKLPSQSKMIDDVVVPVPSEIFGVLDKPALATIRDLEYREIITLGPLVALTLLFGVFPKPVLDFSAASVAQLIDNYNQALGTAKTAAMLVQ